MTGLTPKHYAFLILLKDAGREISNKEMETLYRTKLVNPDYQPLNAAGLVESQTPRGRSYSHRLTPKGEKLLKGELEVKSTKFDPMAWVLPMLHDRYRDAPATTSAPTNDGRSLDERIRSAYTDLSRTQGEWVGLAELRQTLADVSRADLDRALKALYKESAARLEPEPHRHRITPADQDAALEIGGEDRHKLAIGMR